MNFFLQTLSASLLIAQLLAQPCESFAFQPSLRPPMVRAGQHILSSPSRLFLSDEPKDPEAEEDSSGIDVSEDERLYRIRLPRAAGIEWGTDLSFSFVYVRDMESSEPAALSGMVLKGDQICEIKEDGKKAINLLGAPFDYVMDAFSGLGKTTKEIDMVFFHGTKEELKEVCTGNAASADPDMITITVIQNKGADDEKVHEFVVPAGSNIREVCVDNGINVYQSVTRWTNCKGKQLCGTCIVNVAQGALFTNRKSMDEGSTLRENPDSYRLSCVAFAYGDVTVETFPPVNAAQWTR
jgi:ferredoxin